MQWCCDLAVDQCCMGEKRAAAVPRWQASHGAPLWVCLDASPPTVPLCACALMPALTQCSTVAVCRCQPSHVASPPLCLNASPATVGVHRCQPSHGAPLSLCCDACPWCPTVAVKSVFKIHALLLRYMHLDLPHGASELAAPVQFGPTPQPSSARAAGPGPGLGFGWAGAGGLAGGAGPGVRAAPDARPARR